MTNTYKGCVFINNGIGVIDDNAQFDSTTFEGNKIAVIESDAFLPIAQLYTDAERKTHAQIAMTGSFEQKQSLYEDILLKCGSKMAELGFDKIMSFLASSM